MAITQSIIYITDVLNPSDVGADRSHSDQRTLHRIYFEETSGETSSLDYIAGVLFASEGAETPITGDGAQSTQSPTQSGSGYLSVLGTGAQSTQSPIQDGVGYLSILGAGAQATQSPTQSGTGTSTSGITGAGAQSTQSPTQKGGGGDPMYIAGAGNQSTQPPTQSGTALRTIVFTRNGVV